MILLKDANIIQLFAAYTLLIGHSPKEETIIDRIIYTPTSNNQINSVTILSEYKNYRDVIPFKLNDIPNDMSLLEATQKSHILLENAIGHILCKCYSPLSKLELTYYLVGDGKFRISADGVVSGTRDARAIMKELGYDNWRIWNHSGGY